MIGDLIINKKYNSTIIITSSHSIGIYDINVDYVFSFKQLYTYTIRKIHEQYFKNAYEYYSDFKNINDNLKEYTSLVSSKGQTWLC
jgi:hypothetical protein